MAELLTRICHILKFSFIRGAFQPHLQELDLEAPPSPVHSPLFWSHACTTFPDHEGHHPIRLPGFL